MDLKLFFTLIFEFLQLLFIFQLITLQQLYLNHLNLITIFYFYFSYLSIFIFTNHHLF